MDLLPNWFVVTVCCVGGYFGLSLFLCVFELGKRHQKTIDILQKIRSLPSHDVRALYLAKELVSMYDFWSVRHILEWCNDTKIFGHHQQVREYLLRVAECRAKQKKIPSIEMFRKLSCSKCDLVFPTNAAFCPRCGTKVA